MDSIHTGRKSLVESCMDPAGDRSWNKQWTLRRQTLLMMPR